MNSAAAATAASEPNSTHETARDSEDFQDEDGHSYDKPTLDEDPIDEVGEEDVLAQVKLAATIRKAVS